MPGAGNQQPQRTTFRPPWVKNGPPPIPMPTASWALNARRDSKASLDNESSSKTDTYKNISIATDSKKSEQNIDNCKRSMDETSSSLLSEKNYQHTSKADLYIPEEITLLQKGVGSKPRMERQEKIESSKMKADTHSSKSEAQSGVPTLAKNASRVNIPPPPPPRPPPPAPSREILKNLPALSNKQQKTLEMLKSRPRKRPDWACMMKDIETGKKLRHVTCNDRSAPLIERVITKVSADTTGSAHFVFDSEKSNVHNKLLKQIQEGVRLKTVKTNDRSKPILEGLRKFRRQLTIEEQIQKAEQSPVDEVISDEMDDIDAVRDDLQSTKQMLALELKNKEILIKENKILQAQILNLEVEIEQERSKKNSLINKHDVDELTESFRTELQQSKSDNKRLQKEVLDAHDQRDKLKKEVEALQKQYFNLEKRMNAGMALAGCPSSKDVAKLASKKSFERSETGESGEEADETSEEETEEDVNPEEIEKKRNHRETRLMVTKIKNLKNKIGNSRKERHVLKDQIKLQQRLLKEEKRKFLILRKEVDKMAKLMSDNNEDTSDDERDQKQELESEDESASESEESEDNNDSENEDDTALIEIKSENLQSNVKKYEGRLTALKKGNYLLKAQVDRLKDDLSTQREESITLQEDLDSVLAELG